MIPSFRRYANLRMNLLPYICSEAWKSSRTGVPLMRPLTFELPDDPVGRDHPYQYLFGEYLLVAPVVEEGRSTWPVYLPQGEWFDLWTGEAHKGPKLHECQTPKDIIPVFVRAGAFLALNHGDRYELGDAVGNAIDHYHNLCFEVYPNGLTRYDWFDGVTSEICNLTCDERP